jgi:hypothetical protein
MQTLMSLKEKALANPAWFKHIAISGQLGEIVPKKQNVVRCPRVEWEKYGSLGTRLGRELDKPTPVEPLYTVYLLMGASLILESSIISTVGTQGGGTPVEVQDSGENKLIWISVDI